LVFNIKQPDLPYLFQWEKATSFKIAITIKNIVTERHNVACRLTMKAINLLNPVLSPWLSTLHSTEQDYFFAMQNLQIPETPGN
jgi:hypothetical protein